MKNTIFSFLLTLFFANSSLCFGSNLWTKIDADKAPASLQVIHPSSFIVYTLDEAILKFSLFNLSTDPKDAIIISLPLPDGSFRDFRVWQTPMMPDELAANFPDIKTFTGEAIHNSAISVKLDFTVYGFHALIFDAEKTSFIDPWDRYHDGLYMVHYKKDEIKPISERMRCLNGIDKSNTHLQEEMEETLKSIRRTRNRTVNGYQLRSYRLALACSDQYAIAATGLTSPSVSQTLSCMTTTMNRINGVYEREFSITMNFVAHENLLIYTSPVGDPFYADNSNAVNLLDDNQKMCDSLIGPANYDIGHVFSTGSGGLSVLACVCDTSFADKAQSTTGQSNPVGDGFDIDYVAHEMGHEFGSDHTFNNNGDGSCNGNASQPFAFEPGGGSTIMCYAGICFPDDLQPHSDAYFSASSMEQIISFISGAGNFCAAKLPSYNYVVNLPTFNATYSIPYKTPFELISPVAVDSVSDTSNTYCWEQYNLGDFGNSLTNTHYYGPIFRSFYPRYGGTRVFPNDTMVMKGILSNAGNENAEGEKAPDVARFLTFKLSVRDIILGNGCFLFPDDTVHLDVINTGAPFTVSSQASTGISYSGHSTQTVSWNIAGTHSAPINTNNVDIYMSNDGGQSWYYHLGTFPNSGAAIVTVPNPPYTITNARFKVKGNGNVFFNVNTTDFKVTYDTSYPISAGIGNETFSDNFVKIFPVPATNVLNIITESNDEFHAIIFNAFGQEVWKGELTGKLVIPISAWSKGVYYLLLNDSNGKRFYKKIIVQ